MSSSVSTSSGSAHERVAVLMRAEGEELRSSNGYRTAPKSPSSPSTDGGAAAASPKSLVALGMIVWALAFFAALAFLIQGGTLDSLTRGRQTAHEVIAARFAGAAGAAALGGSGGGGGGDSGGGSGDGDALVLVRRLTRALDAATTSLEIADEEAASLRSRLRALGDGAAVDAAAAKAVKAGKEAEEFALRVARAAAATDGDGGGDGGVGGGLADGVRGGLAAASGATDVEDGGDVRADIDGGGGDGEDGIPDLPLAAVLAASNPSLDCVTCFSHGPGLRTRVCTNAQCPTTPKGAELVIATSLYGDDPRYTRGVVRNAELVPIIMPGWCVGSRAVSARSHSRAHNKPPLPVNHMKQAAACVCEGRRFTTRFDSL